MSSVGVQERFISDSPPLLAFIETAIFACNNNALISAKGKIGRPRGWRRRRPRRRGFLHGRLTNHPRARSAIYLRPDEAASHGQHPRGEAAAIIFAAWRNQTKYRSTYGVISAEVYCLFLVQFKFFSFCGWFLRKKPGQSRGIWKKCFNQLYFSC